jgi:hypothetical protein
VPGGGQRGGQGVTPGGEAQRQGGAPGHTGEREREERGAAQRAPSNERGAQRLSFNESGDLGRAHKPRLGALAPPPPGGFGLGPVGEPGLGARHMLPPSRGEGGARSKPHFVKDAKRASGDGPAAAPPRLNSMELLPHGAPHAHRSPRALGAGGGMQGASRLGGPAKAYGRPQALRGAGGAEGGDARSNRSSHGGRMRKGPSSGAHGAPSAPGAPGAAGHSAGYKSVAGYNSMQIPEEDRYLLAALGP